MTTTVPEIIRSYLLRRLASAYGGHSKLCLSVSLGKFDRKPAMEHLCYLRGRINPEVQRELDKLLQEGLVERIGQFYFITEKGKQCQNLGSTKTSK